MLRTSAGDGHAFIDDIEEASLLGFSAGPGKRIQSFEIEQARQIRRKTGICLRFCGWMQLLLFLSISVNIGMTILVDRVSEGTISKSIVNPNRQGGANHTIIYGHLHMAKTAGTEINGLLAARYDHVCGNKGYSLDYYQYNERVKNSTSRDIRSIVTDSVSNATLDASMNRGRVPFEIMTEIGFEDCDWISMENSWDIWPHTMQRLGRKWKMELHVPCRDPLDHLLSMCHYKGIEFDCLGDDLDQEIEACVMAMDRFSLELQASSPKIQLKCFESEDVDLYVKHMSQRLEARRIPVTNIVHRQSDGKVGPRDEEAKRHECVGWYPHIADQVRELLLKKYDYYSWCEECLMSDKDLFAWIN